MKRAYEYDFELITGAIPVVLKEEEQTWEAAFETDEKNWEYVKLLWGAMCQDHLRRKGFCWQEYNRCTTWDMMS